LDGENVALDFANTVSRRKVEGGSRDHLDRYGRLVSWAQQAGLLNDRRAERLRKRAHDHPRAAVAALRRAIAVREAIFSIFSAVAARRRPPADALDRLNSALPIAYALPRLIHDANGFQLRFADDDEDLAASLIAPVVRAALALVTSDDRERVRECHSTTCAWLFLDHSKNGTRVWCDMKVCGNRAKAKRHYAKGKKAPNS
jgi:predicted RNA-binding Zn ribbon-like protein